MGIPWNISLHRNNMILYNLKPIKICRREFSHQIGKKTLVKLPKIYLWSKCDSKPFQTKKMKREKLSWEEVVVETDGLSHLEAWIVET